MRKMTIEECKLSIRIDELEKELKTLRKITQDLRMDIDILKSKKKDKGSGYTDTFEAEIKSKELIDFFMGGTSEKMKEKKRKAAKHTQLKPCPCGLYPEIYCDCEKTDKGDAWVYEIYCANEDCDCYLTYAKMLKTDEDPFEFEEEIRKDWNKMVEGKLED